MANQKYVTIKLSRDSVYTIEWALMVEESKYCPNIFTGKWDKDEKKDYLQVKRLHERFVELATKMERELKA